MPSTCVQKNPVELLWHLAVVPCVAVKFGAAWKGGTIVNSSGNCCGGEGLGAKDAFVEEVVILVANDITNAAWNNCSDRLVFQCPSLAGEGIDISERGGLLVVVAL